MSPRNTWNRLLAGGVASALSAGVLLALIPILFGRPLPMIRVDWRNISEPDRIGAEQRLQLSEPAPIGGRAWYYVPLDTSPQALLAVVTDPAVEDTRGIDRRTFQITDSPALTPRRGGLLAGPRWMAGGTRLLAYALAGLSALLMLSALLSSPRLGPGSTARTRMAGRLRDPAGTLRTLPHTLGAGLRQHTTAVAVILVFLATVAWRFLTFTGFTNDHYAHLALAQQMLLGDRPIRDFADPGWPLTYLLTAAGWLLAGNSMATEWTITALGFGIGAACTVAVARQLSGSLTIALLVTTFEVLIYPRSYSYPKMLVYGAFAWIILGLARRPSTRRIVLTALAIAIAFLLRHDHGLFVGAAAAACVFLATRSQGWRDAVRRVTQLTAITAAFLLPWILFVSFNGGLLAYFEAGLDYSRGEAAATALTSLPGFQGGGMTTMNANAWLFWLFWSLPVLAGVIVWRRARGHREQWVGELPTVVALVIMSVLVNGSFIRQALEVRIPDAVVPAVLLAAYALRACWTNLWRQRGLQWAVRFVTIAGVVVSGAAVSQISVVADQYDNAMISRGLSGIRIRTSEVIELLRRSHRGDTPSRYSAALAPFFDYLDRCSSQSDRLIVTGEFPDVLVLAGRRFAGDGVVFGAWYSSSVHQDRTLAQIEEDPALFALHMGDYSTFQERFNLIDQYLNREYDEMAEVAVPEAGTIRILKLRRRAPVGTDAATGWPCFTTRPTPSRP
ncbi:MAG: hypothetical protein HOP16_02110 [Acidobacteria bacterium]|nr:hypothetical protein [Acidobacteriota bacterium]